MEPPYRGIPEIVKVGKTEICAVKDGRSGEEHLLPTKKALAKALPPGAHDRYR
jgi:hypothetical protein